RIESVTAVGIGTVPFQVLGEERVVIHEMSRFETPWALHARRIHLLWWAPSVPPCGYAAFDIQFSVPHSVLGVPQPRQATPVAAERIAENEFLHVAVNDNGAFDVTDKASGTVYRGVGTLDDTGDVGDE